MLFLYILVFLLSCAILAFSSEWLIEALSRIAKFLGWKEFVVAFLMMAFGASLPNFFVGILSAINKIPELSLSDVVGGNIIDLSLVVGLAALISKMGLSAHSRTVQTTSLFTLAIAVFPVFLIADGVLSRADAFLLLFAFIIYIFWLFGKKERFTKSYDGVPEKPTIKFFFSNLGRFSLAVILLLLAAEGIVKSSTFFADYFNFPIALIGILIVGIGTSLPETFFSLNAARKSQDWMVLGDLMGGVIITATLVLGIVALITPIRLSDPSAIYIGRGFLIVAAIFFAIFLRTGRKITKKEGMFLVGIYALFVLVEIFAK